MFREPFRFVGGAVLVLSGTVVLIAIGIGWVIGVVPVAAWGSPMWMGAAWLAAGAPGLVIAGPLKGRERLAVAMVVAALLSGWRFDSGTATTSPEWLSLIGEEVELTGVVASEPDRNEITTGYTLRVTAMGSGSATTTGGKVIVYLNQYDEYLPGDSLTVYGKLEAAPKFDGFDYRAYLARRGISATMFRPRVEEARPGGQSLSRWLTAQRLDLDASLRRSLPEPASSLAAGIAFGRDDGLSYSDKDEFNRSGLRHLVAVSGSNVTIVAAFVYVIAVPTVGRRRAWIPASVAIAAYLGAAGLAPSVMRAGLMAGTFLLGSALGRPQGGLPALFAAVVGMTAFAPGLATDSGFLLSATATGGIITLYPRIESWLRWLTFRSRYTSFPAWVCQAAAITTAATVSTMPVMWVTFERVSLVSLLANMVIEPFFVLAFLLSILTAGTGLVSHGAGAVVGIPAFYALAFISWSADAFASLPGASVGLPRGSVSSALIAYVGLGFVALVSYRFPPGSEEEPLPVRTRRQTGNRFLVCAAVGVALVAIIPISILPGRSTSELTVRFFDVGQGDAAMITTPNGRQVLIDGGPSGTRLARGLGRSMPHWDRSIDAVILTHPQEDHLAGLVEVADRYSVGTVYENGRSNATATFGYFDDRLPKRTRLQAGDAFVIDGVTFEVVWPRGGVVTSNVNDVSLVVRVTFGEVSFLFTGDAEGTALAEIPTEQLAVDVLKVPHHGSKTTPTGFFDAVSPEAAVISVGEDNIFGHPHPDTLAALTNFEVFRTDQNGTVTVTSDGKRVRVSTTR